MKKSFLSKYQWHLLVFGWGIALGLGIGGFAHYAALHDLQNSFWDNFYLTLQLIPMNSGGLTQPIPLELDVARFSIPLLAAATAVKALWAMLQERIRSTKLMRLSNHVIICGLSRKGMLMATQLRQAGDEVVIIERNEKNEWLESCKQQDMFVLSGDASEPGLLRQAGVGRARALLAVCDEDGVNAGIAVQAHSLAGERSGQPLACMAHITDPQLCILLRENEELFQKAPFRMELFNVFERGARKLLQQFPAWDETTIAQNRKPHILVIGVGRMGESLIMQAGRDWWRQQPDRSWRFIATIIDRDASQKVESMLVRYPHLCDVCEIIPLDMDVHSPAFERAAFLFDKHGQVCIDRIYICLDDDALGLHTGLALCRQLPGKQVPVVIRMSENNGLAKLLEDQKINGGGFQNLIAYGLLDRICMPDLLDANPLEVLARAAHENYVNEQVGPGLLKPEDPSVQPWEKLDKEYKNANYQWVGHVSKLLGHVGYKIMYYADWDIPNFEFPPEKLERMAQMEHEMWCEDKLRDGWRYASGTKNLKEKTNPDLVPWEKLSPVEREKNRQFVRCIPATIERVGYKIST